MSLVMIRNITETIKEISKNPFSVVLLLGFGAFILAAIKQGEVERQGPNTRLILDQIENHPPTPAEIAWGIACVIFIISACFAGVLLMSWGLQ